MHCIVVKFIELWILFLFSCVADGSLVIKSNENFTINTTAGKAENTQYKLFFRNHSFEITGKSNTPYKWSYSVAHLVFEGDITFEEGSHVVLTGAHALSIKSVKGDITVNTAINVTCTAAGANETCLGGYTVLATPAKSNDKYSYIYRGMGPFFALPFSCSCIYVFLYHISHSSIVRCLIVIYHSHAVGCASEPYS